MIHDRGDNMKRFLLVVSIILGIACLTFIFLGIFYISQTIGDVATSVDVRKWITYIALFVLIPYGIIFGVLAVLAYIKHRNYN